MTVHPHDLLAIKVQDEIKRQQRNTLTYLSPEADDQYEVLFKYFETLKAHESTLKELLERAAGYKTDHIFGAKILAKPRQMEIIEEQFRMLQGKSDSLLHELTRARDLVSKVTDERHLHGLDGLKTQQKSSEDL